jgi:hypothetical protein
MSRYRTVHCQIWNDDKFPFTSDDCKLVWFHLRTTPFSTGIGIFKAPLPGLAAEIRWPLPRYSKAFREGLGKRFWKVDERFHVVFFPNHFKYSKPENPNVLKAWIKMYEDIPDCQLKCESIEQLKAFAKGWGKAFESLCQTLGVTFPKQEQEQEQEQEEKLLAQTSDESVPEEEVFATLPCTGKQKEFVVTKAYVSEMQSMYPGVDIEKETLRAKGWLINNPKKQKTHNGMTRFLGSWYDRQQNNAGQTFPQVGNKNKAPQLATDEDKRNYNPCAVG